MDCSFHKGANRVVRKNILVWKRVLNFIAKPKSYAFQKNALSSAFELSETDRK